MDTTALQLSDATFERGRGHKYRSVTANCNVEFDDHVIYVDSTAGDVTLTLPSAAACIDSTNYILQEWQVFHVAGTNACYVARRSTDTIDAAALISVPLHGMRKIRCESSTTFVTTGGAPAGMLTIAIPFTLGNRSGPNSDGVQIGTLTHTAFTDVCNYEATAPAYTDLTTEAGEATANDVVIPDPFDENDAIYFGYTGLWCAAIITVGTQGAGDAVAAETVFEYYNGSAWATVESSEFLDDSAAWTTGAAKYVVSFLPPSDWATVSVDSGTACYFLRMRAAADDVYNTTQPKVTQMWCVPLNVGDGIRCPMSGMITKADMLASTASATNNDTELLLVNITKGTFKQLTWTGGDTSDQVTVGLAVSQGDELAVVTLSEDGTTEFANGALYLTING